MSAPIVDAQVHIWAAERPDRPWPPGGAQRAHRPHPFGAEDLLAEMDAAGVDRAVLVPPSYEGDYNDLVLDAATRWPHRFAAMVRIPLTQPMSAAQLRGFMAQPGLFGVRVTLHLPETQRWLRDGTADWFWPLAEQAGLRVMALPVGALPEIDAIATRHPRLRLCIDHMSQHRGLTEKPRLDHDEITRLVALARHPGVVVKSSCVPYFSAQSYPFRDTEPALRRVFDAFGPQRMFWGSDMTRLACPYRQAVTQFTEELPWLQGEARDLVMGRALLDWLGWR